VTHDDCDDDGGVCHEIFYDDDGGHETSYDDDDLCR
jgi:hypothetical protein